MKSRKNSSVPGFMTLIMIFLVICLASIGGAALSATTGGDRLVGRTEEYLTSYREARNLSEKHLAEVDGCIAAAAHSGVFDLNFEALVSELDYIRYRTEGQKYIISCETPVDASSAVYWEISVDMFPADGRGGYEIISHRVKDISSSDEEEEEHLNVWLG